MDDNGWVIYGCMCMCSLSLLVYSNTKESHILLSSFHSPFLLPVKTQSHPTWLPLSVAIRSRSLPQRHPTSRPLRSSTWGRTRSRRPSSVQALCQQSNQRLRGLTPQCRQPHRHSLSSPEGPPPRVGVLLLVERASYRVGLHLEEGLSSLSQSRSPRRK